MKERKTYFIDTNVFIRFFVKEDEKHFFECSGIMQRMRRGEIRGYINSLVLAEVNWVLKTFYRFSKKDILYALQSIISLPNLWIDDRNDPAKAVFLYQRHNVKFIDAMIASHALVADWKIPVISYDSDFSKLGIVHLTPRQATK